MSNVYLCYPLSGLLLFIGAITFLKCIDYLSYKKHEMMIGKKGTRKNSDESNAVSCCNPIT